MKILLIAPNSQCIQNLLPLADKVGEEGMDVFFLNLDSLYKQDTSSRFRDFKVIDFGVSAKIPFYFLGKFGKVKTLLKVYLKAKDLGSFSHIVFGSIGSPEFLIAKELKKKSNSKIHLIQDSILFSAESKKSGSSLRDFLSNGTNRKNICDYIFVSGDATKEVLLKDGIEEDKIIVSGIPRFKYIFERNVKESADDTSAVFMTSAFKWHFGNNVLEEKQIDLVRMVESVCKDIGVKLTIRLHPRIFLKPETTYAEIESPGITIEESISNHNTIISAHSISTTLLESLWYKKRIIFISENLENRWDLKYLEKALIWSDIVGLKQAMIDGTNDFSKSEYYISQKTIDSVDFIFDAIFQG